MTLPMIQTYRLTPRGGGGLACEKAGVALGPTALVRALADAAGRWRCGVRSPQGLGLILSAPYGPQPEQVVLRFYRGFRRAACAIEAGDLCLAGVEAVLLGFPDVTPSGLAKLADVAEFEKGGAAWENEPRAPAGQADGGQWTAEEAGGAPASEAKPTAHATPASQTPSLPLNDGVYRPGMDAPRIVPAGAGAEEEEPASRRSNGPPEDFTFLEDVFPGLRDARILALPLTPIDGILGFSALSDETPAMVTLGQYRGLIGEIQQIDPTFHRDELFPPGEIAELSRQARDSLINGLLMERAAAYYRTRGDVRRLQVETLRFLQGAVDDAYKEAVSIADAGRLQPRLSREEAIGNWVDLAVRKDLRRMFNTYGIPFGADKDITVNYRNYETSQNDTRYRIPDARLGDVAFDWTLSSKTIGDAQIRGFFRADSRPRAVIIVRPSPLGPGSTYLIPRPLDVPF